MLATLLGSIAVATALVDGPPPPITVSFSDGGQYNVGAYAQVQFRAAADGYVIIFQADQDGRVRVLFPLDPGDDDFIRGGKTYKIIGRDSRGSFYLDDAGGSGMVFAAWSKSPFRFAEFTRGDHWDFSILDQYNASDDPESQLTDLALHMTDQGFDYAIDRYIVFNNFVESSTTNTFIGVSGWPWPAFSTGWTVGVGFGSPCCFNPWFWNPWPSSVWWGSAGWGWGWGWGWGPPVAGWGWGWGAPGWGAPGWGSPGWGWGTSGSRAYTFKPGGTGTTPGSPYRPRGDAFAPQSSAFQAGYRGRSTLGLHGTDRLANDAATISGRAEAGRRPVARPTPGGESSRTVGGASGRPAGGTNSGGGGRRSSGGTPLPPTPISGGGANRSTSGQGAVAHQVRPDPRGPSAPRGRSAASPEGERSRARGWTSDGNRLPPSTGRSRSGASSGGDGASDLGLSGVPQRRGGGAGGQARSGTGSSNAQPQGRSPGYSPTPRSSSGGGQSGGSGARSSGGGGSGGGGGARSGGGGGGGGGRRGR